MPRSRQANYQLRNRATGHCAGCGAPCGGYRCPKCREARRDRQKLMMRKRRADGLVKD